MSRSGRFRRGSSNPIALCYPTAAAAAVVEAVLC